MSAAPSGQVGLPWVWGFLGRVGGGGAEVRSRGRVCFGVPGLLSCWRKDQAAIGKPRLQQAEPMPYLVMVKDVLLLLEGSYLGFLGALRTLKDKDNDFGLFASKEHRLWAICVLCMRLGSINVGFEDSPQLCG